MILNYNKQNQTPKSNYFFKKMFFIYNNATNSPKIWKSYYTVRKERVSGVFIENKFIIKEHNIMNQQKS